MHLTWCRFCNTTLDVDLTSGDTAFGGDDSIEFLGMGSLKERNGVLEVQDDFEFVTIDAVSNPSNQGSWGTLKEGIDYSNINPYSKVNSIVTEILCAQGTCPIW